MSIWTLKPQSRSVGVRSGSDNVLEVAKGPAMEVKDQGCFGTAGNTDAL